MYNDHALRCAPPNGHPTDHFQRIFGQVLLTMQRFRWPGRRQGAPSTSQPGPNPPGGVAMGEGRGSFAPATRWCPPAVPPRLRCMCPFGAGEPAPNPGDQQLPSSGCARGPASILKTLARGAMVKWADLATAVGGPKLTPARHHRGCGQFHTSCDSCSDGG